MKYYYDDEVKSWHWVKIKKYVHSSDDLRNPELWKKLKWELIEKVPIEKIIYDSSIYPNILDLSIVLNMIEEFYPFAFHPIIVDKKYNLLDGLHRLTFAQWSDLKFIDVLMDFKF